MTQTNTFAAFGSAYAASAIAQDADDRDFASALHGLNFEAWNKARDEFIGGAASAGYAAPEKLWERTIKRLNELFGVEKPKAETKKAQEVAAKRDAAKAAADTISMARLKMPATLAAPADLLELAKDSSLTGANKKALIDAALKREKEITKEKADATKAEAEAIYGDVLDFIKKHKHDPKMLGKIKAALAKIK